MNPPPRNSSNPITLTMMSGQVSPPSSKKNLSSPKVLKTFASQQTKHLSNRKKRKKKREKSREKTKNWEGRIRMSLCLSTKSWLMNLINQVPILPFGEILTPARGEKMYLFFILSLCWVLSRLDNLICTAATCAGRSSLFPSFFFPLSLSSIQENGLDRPKSSFGRV